MKKLPKFSLRELLGLCLLTGLGLTALTVGGLFGSLTMLAAIVFVMSMAIVACVGKRSLQAFAIGFLMPTIVYGISLWSLGWSESNVGTGKLPTSKLLSTLFQAVVKTEPVSVNANGGWVPPPANPYYAPAPPNGNPAPTFAVTPPTVSNGPIPVTLAGIESINRQEFMTLGHMLFAMLFGYIGAKFAVVLYLAQLKQSGEPVSERP